MLESITIHNFQKHKKLRIDFDEHITVITGRSDSGKSAIIRALRWVCFNQPSGDAFIQRDSTTCSVSLKADSRSLKRTKGKWDNSYTLDRKQYHALGQGNVPEDVTKLLNVNSINFQGQHDSPFWFSLTAGEVSRQINQIVNLQLIDKVLSHVASDLRRVKAAVQVSETRLEDAKASVSSLSWAKAAKASLEQIEVLYASIQEKSHKASLLRDLITDVQSLTEQRDRAAGASVDAGKLFREAEAYRKRKESAESLRSLIDEISQCEADLKRARKECSQMLTELDKQMDGKCPLCKQPVEEGMLCTVQLK